MANDGEIVFYSLVVNECTPLEVGHIDFGGADARRSGGHTGSQTLHGASDLGCSMRQVQHPAQGRGQGGPKEITQYMGASGTGGMVAVPALPVLERLPPLTLRTNPYGRHTVVYCSVALAK